MPKVHETDTVRVVDVGPTLVSGAPLAKLALKATGGDRDAAAALLKLQLTLTAGKLRRKALQARSLRRRTIFDKIGYYM